MTIEEFGDHCAQCNIENKYELVYCTLAKCRHLRAYRATTKEKEMKFKEMYDVEHDGFKASMNLNGIVNLFQGEVEKDLVKGMKDKSISVEYRDFLVELSKNLDKWRAYN